MNKIPRKIIWILVVVFGIYLISNIGFIIFGKPIIISQIEKNLKTKATLDRVTLGFPLFINISGLKIEDLLGAEMISVSPSILGFLTGRIVLNNLELDSPEIAIVRNSDGSFNLPYFKSKGKQPPFLLAGLRIRDGRLTFIDKKLDSQGYRIALRDININISKVAFPPTSLYARFNASAFLADKRDEPSGRLSASGWIDFGPKNMDGRIELKDIDATAIAPYYQNIISSKKLLSAKLNFTSELKAKNNDLTAVCHAEFTDVIYEKPLPSETQKSIDLIPNVLDLFSDASGNISLAFTINTKLDNPKIDLVSLKGTIAQAATQNIANQPSEKVVENVKDAVEQFKEFGKSLKDMFKKE